MIPNKIVTIRPSDPPWFTCYLRKLIRKRKRAHKKAKLKNTHECWRKFRKLRNDTVNSVKRAKKNLNDKLASQLESKNISSKDWWKTLKILIRKDKTDPIPALVNNGLLVTDPSVPDNWKRANVTPVHKKDDKTRVENYRPISLISTLGKVLEKIIYKRLHNFFLVNGTITNFQSGFTCSDSL